MEERTSSIRGLKSAFDPNRKSSFRINHWCVPGIRRDNGICEVATSVNQQAATLAVNIAARRRAACLLNIKRLILAGENPVASGLQADNIA